MRLDKPCRPPLNLLAMPVINGNEALAGIVTFQAATLMVRALATGKAQLKDWFALLRKEICISASLGLCMGLAVSCIGIFRAGPEIAVVALIMVCTVLFGSLVGMSLPFVLSKLKMDPATASAPLITSIADIGGVLIYFSIAT